ncbi:xanthine phosphoribosyltransferase [Dethiobacter alkaliphilus]|uniref:xanthine phosphoribosyltransferase n=1 Tax=Dethiobacter alkaliphilus TaxID=427926 RepID=UPI002227DE3A|nr:xanthine phosphoribosyltransferase [Dethiobacter alkaliphilus]MCW3490692.1 xanthine phosphoribosyltransferase [Dethiobacter alkaliphilus]
MQLLREKILTQGKTLPGNILKVDSFLNHQIDIDLLNEIGKEFRTRFQGKNVSKILTIEASGIAVAVIAAQYFNVPVVFAKKTVGKNMDKAVYIGSVYSYTKAQQYNILVSKEAISQEDNILIVDDFLANGQAILGLKEIIDAAGANLVGAGIVIEKGFQKGGRRLRDSGINIQSLAIIDSLEENKIVFRNE